MPGRREAIIVGLWEEIGLISPHHVEFTHLSSRTHWPMSRRAIFAHILLPRWTRQYLLLTAGGVAHDSLLSNDGYGPRQPGHRLSGLNTAL